MGRWVWLAASLAAPLSLLAHGDLHERIAALSLAIQASPTNASLFLQRGELHRLHQEAELARLEGQIERAPRKEFLLCRRATILEEAGRLDGARQSWLEAGRALETLPSNRRAVPAVEALAKQIQAALARLGRIPAA